MSDSLTASKHKYAISKETIQDNSSHTLRVGVDRCHTAHHPYPLCALS